MFWAGMQFFFGVMAGVLILVVFIASASVIGSGLSWVRRHIFSNPYVIAFGVLGLICFLVWLVAPDSLK